MPTGKRDQEARLEAVADLLWGKPRLRLRGPKPTHSLDDIVAASVGIADREGLAAVTIERVAKEMKFTKMALYRYVPGRFELVALMTDRAFGPPPELPVAGWRQGMMAWAAAAFSGFLAHPWVRETMVGRRVVGPNEARWMETALKTLSETRLTGGERLDLLAVVAGHVRSIAQQIAAQSGGTSTERDMTWSLDTTLIGRDGFQELARAVASARDQDAEDNAFDFGLRCIFDGVERRMSSKQVRSKNRRTR